MVAALAFAFGVAFADGLHPPGLGHRLATLHLVDQIAEVRGCLAHNQGTGTYFVQNLYILGGRVLFQLERQPLAPIDLDHGQVGFDVLARCNQT